MGDTVALVLQQLSHVRGVAVGEGAVPTNFFVQRYVVSEARDETAREVLMRVFDEAETWARADGGQEIRLSWKVLYDVNMKAYFFTAGILYSLTVNKSKLFYQQGD